MAAVHPCQCKCGCPGTFTNRERAQSISRCVACRRDPGPTCKRVHRTFEALPLIREVRRVVVMRQDHANAYIEQSGETARIERTLARLAAARKAKRAASWATR